MTENAIRCSKCDLVWVLGGHYSYGMPCPSCGGILRVAPHIASEIRSSPSDKPLADALNQIARLKGFCQEWARMFADQLRAENELKSKISVKDSELILASDKLVDIRRVAAARFDKIRELEEKLARKNDDPANLRARLNGAENDRDIWRKRCLAAEASEKKMATDKSAAEQGLRRSEDGTTWVDEFTQEWDRIRTKGVPAVDPIQDGLLKVYGAFAKMPKPPIRSDPLAKRGPLKAKSSRAKPKTKPKGRK